MVELNGHRLGNSKIQVEEAKPKEGEEHHRVPLASIGNVGVEGRRTEHKRIRGSPRRSISRSRSREFDGVRI